MSLDLWLCLLEQQKEQCCSPPTTQDLHEIKAVVPPAQVMVIKAASGDLCLYTCFSRVLLFQSPALVSKYEPRGLQWAGFWCIHQTVARGTLNWTVKWSTVGCEGGLLCQKTLPKGTSTWPGDLFFKRRRTFKPHKVISGWPKNPRETQMTGLKESHALLPASPLCLCPA